MAKKKKTFKAFPAKVLLFGEHIINKGARGLALPTDLYTGKLSFSSTKKHPSCEHLEYLASYIIKHPSIEKKIAINDFLTDIENGLIFESDIPVGYGLGSSGAFVASIFEAYGNEALKKADSAQIKNYLASLESCFHGKSSGLDPIVSYLNKPLLVSADTTQIVSLPIAKETNFAVSLINSGIPRKTSDWVSLFMKRAKTKDFGDMLEQSLLPANDVCIDAFLKKKYTQFWKALKIVSQLQLQYMADFIPSNYHTAWEQGLKYNDFYLKICGAGGGGFILCFHKKDANVPIPGLKTMLEF